VTFDGIGTAVTPFGEFDNCIRVKTESIYLPSLTDTFIDYSWYYNSLSNVIARHQRSNFFEGHRSLVFQSNLNSSLSALYEEEIPSGIISYHNNGLFSFKNLSGQFLAHIYDLNGKLIQSRHVNLEDNSEIHFSLDESSENIYVLLLINKKTSSFLSKKFLK